MTPETERLMTETDAQRSQRLPLRELLVEGVLAALLLAGMLALALLAPADRAFNLPLAAAFVAGYVVLHRLEFRVGAGNFTPDRAAGRADAPAAADAARALARRAGDDVGQRRRGACAAGAPPNRLLLAFNDAGFALTPALVLVALGAQTPDWDLWPAYLAALAAQFAADFVRDPARAWLGCGVSPRVVAPELVEAHRVDAMLAPAGLLVAFAAIDAPAAVLLILPLLKLFQGFAAQHDERVEQSIELGRAYRGTALLLGDLLEEDDEYTGHHTQDVVELSLRVAARLGVSEEVRRDTELGALVHDIGKIAIPERDRQQARPLDDEEWAVMKTHTSSASRCSTASVACWAASAWSSVPRTSASTAAATRTGSSGVRSRSPRGSSSPATPSTP